MAKPIARSATSPAKTPGCVGHRDAAFLGGVEIERIGTGSVGDDDLKVWQSVDQIGFKPYHRIGGNRSDAIGPFRDERCRVGRFPQPMDFIDCLCISIAHCA